MAKHMACMTFDFDAMSGLIARGMKSPTAISRGEFGVIGVRRVLALLKKHNIPATFYVPGVVIEMYPQVCEEIVASGHEIGHHGWNHVPPENSRRKRKSIFSEASKPSSVSLASSHAATAPLHGTSAL